MKIKSPSRKHKVKAALRAKNGDQWWLVPAPQKRKGRLKQLNKSGRKTRVESEFVKLAKSLENDRRSSQEAE